MDYSLFIPAFIAGILMFLAPCTLPLVPAYLSFISGVSLDDLARPAAEKKLRRKIFLTGLAFVFGFSVVFVVLGTLAGFLGQTLVLYRVWLGRVGGIFVILFGLAMLGVLNIPFLRGGSRLATSTFFQRGTALNSFILGSAFASGWTPCVGPILASILFLASMSATALDGALLLSVFSLGLAVPFLVMALAVGAAIRLLSHISPYLNIVSVIGGLFLMALGVLLLTGNMSLLISYGYRLLRFIGYERLLDYL